jgi:hypothetical protein
MAKYIQIFIGIKHHAVTSNGFEERLTYSCLLG